MRPTRILRIELATHAHATEDASKVREALLRLVPGELHSTIRISEVVIEGHYSNPITRLTAIVEGEAAEKVIEHIGRNMDEYEKSILASTLEQRYEKKTGRLYIRFSKQDAYLGRLRVYDGDDVVRLVIVFRGSPSIRDVERILKEKGLLQ